MRQLRSGLRALGALLLLLLLLLGVPAALAATGNPLAALPNLLAGDVPDTALVAVLAAVAWVAWAQFALATAAEVLSAARRRPAPRIPGVLRSQQQLARALVLALFVLGSASSLITSSATPAGTPAPSPAAVTQMLPAAWQAPLTALTAHAAGDTMHAPAQQVKVRDEQTTVLYTVPPPGEGPGTLWDIAQDKLGNGARWQEIWHLNEGRAQPGGVQMTSPSRLRPGWTVRIPSDAPASTTSGAHTTGAPSSSVAVTVQAGDSLSGLAAEHGQGDWHRAWHANAGRAEPGGQHFTDPDLLRPGWTVALPGPSTLSGAGRTVAAPAGGPATPAAPHEHRPVGQPAAPAGPEPAPQHGLREGLPAPVGPEVPVVPVPPAPAPPVAPSGSPAPTPAVGGSAQASHDQQQQNERPGQDTDHVDAAEHAASSVALLGGGGAMLAAGVVLVLLRLRRRQFRERTLGRTISSTPYALAPIEKALLARSVAGVPDVTWLDAALHQLVWATGAQGAEVPEAAAARLTPTVLELVLTVARTDAPAPWRSEDSGLRWTVQRSDLDGAASLQRAGAADLLVAPPYPALVSVGYTDDGDHWLLDLEQIGAVALTGDRERCLDLARFLAAELAHNSWAELLQVDLVGFGAELAPLYRVRHHDDGPAAVRSLRAAVRENTRALQEWDSTVLHGRMHLDDVGDGWPPRVLMVAPQVPAGEGPDGLQGLLEELLEQPSRTAIAVVLAADSGHTVDTRWQLHVDERGQLTIPALDVTLTAQQVPANEAADLAALIVLAADGNDEPMPAATGDQPWDALTDAAGAPLPDLVTQRNLLPSVDQGEQDGHDVVTDLLARYKAYPQPAVAVPQVPTGQEPGDDTDRAEDTGLEAEQDGHAGASPRDEVDVDGDDPATSVLPQPAATYLAVTATTVQDVITLAPAITAEVRDHIEADNTGLDEDLAAWLDPASGLARLTLLGPVDLEATGTRPGKRLRYYLEIVAYLAAHPSGVTAAQMAADFWPDESDENALKSRARIAVSHVRTWLGEDPRTGGLYLPTARDNANGVYLLQGLLVDADLFRRLRVRGVARGDAGIVDLQAALALVVGPPLQHRREEGYGWLVDTPLEHHYTASVVDTAHLVADICLAAGNPQGALAAAQVSRAAGDTSDVALLDLVAAYDALGDQAQAQAHVRMILANHEAEVEEDLPPRTYEILSRRRWLPSHSRFRTG